MYSHLSIGVDCFNFLTLTFRVCMDEWKSLFAPCTAQTPWRKSWVPSRPQREKSPLWAWRRTSSMGWVSRFPRLDMSQSPALTYIRNWHFRVFADIDICLCFLQAFRSWAETTLAAPIPAPSSAPSLPGVLLMSMGASNLVRWGVSASFFSCVGVRIEVSALPCALLLIFDHRLQVTASFWWTTSTSRASLMPLRLASCRTQPMMSPWWCRSPKRGSTKVKEASWLLFVSGLKNFSEFTKRPALKSLTH